MVSACFAQCKAGGHNPYGAVEDALTLGRTLSPPGVRAEIRRLRALPAQAPTFLLIAELQKEIGDYGATASFQQAIAADQSDPTFEFFFGEYLRIFRGAEGPLFEDARAHYRRALSVLAADKQLGICHDWDDVTEVRLRRSLIALYERDGIALTDHGNPFMDMLDLPWLFLGGTQQFARNTADIGQVADIRDLTAELLEAQSRSPQPLTSNVIAAIVRRKNAFDTLERLRLRPRWGPAVDLLYTDRYTSNASITQFCEPNVFNRLAYNGGGVAIEKPLNIGALDLLVQAQFTHLERQGLIEFLPDATENVLQYDAHVAASRFVGPDKVTIAGTYVLQDISPQASGYERRLRHFVASSVTYQLFRRIPFLHQTLASNSGLHFQLRGVELFSGFLRDTEQFNFTDASQDARVNREDYYVGVALRSLGPFDVTVQPTLLQYEKIQYTPRVSQFRTNANLLYRIVDEESRQTVSSKAAPINLAFLHVVIPFKYDIARVGPAFFENYKVGAALNAKFFRTARSGPTFLANAGYDFQVFPDLKRDFHLFSFGLSMGF
jgi:hypothetical protein